MTFCETIVVTFVVGVISSIAATYITRYIDNRHKDNRHGK